MNQKELTEEYYDGVGADYLERATAESSQECVGIILSAISDIADGRLVSVLDAGCGPVSVLHGMDFPVVAIDVADSMIEHAKSLPAANVKYMKGDIETFKAKKPFDVIVAKGVIEYLESDDKLMKNAFDLLKPGGYLIVQYRNAEFKYGDPNYKNPMPMKRRVHRLEDVRSSANVFGFEFKDADYYHHHNGMSSNDAASAFVVTFKKIGD